MGTLEVQVVPSRRPNRAARSDVCFGAATSASSRAARWKAAVDLLAASVRAGFRLSVVLLNSAEACPYLVTGLAPGIGVQKSRSLDE